MSRRRRRAAEPLAPPQWPLEVAFWLPLVAAAAYLLRAHRAHLWTVLHWGVLAGIVGALFVRLARSRRRAVSSHGTGRSR